MSAKSVPTDEPIGYALTNAKKDESFITAISSGFNDIISTTSAGSSIQGFTTGGCIDTWPNTYPHWPTTYQTYPNYVYVQGDAVNIGVIETIDGFKGQISMTIAGKAVIIWESIAERAADFAAVASKGKNATDGRKEAQEAAKGHAEAQAEKVLKALFSK